MKTRLIACGLGLWSLLLVVSLPANAISIVINGSFEDPIIAPNSFAVFPSILGWNTSPGSFIEIQSGVAGAPFAGNQFVELDSFGSNSRNIFQDLLTVPGVNYALSFAFSPRPGTTKADNTVDVLLSGISLLSIPPTPGGANTMWTVFNAMFTASGTATRLEFQDLGTGNSFGSYIDDVSVVARTSVPEPSSLFLLVIGLAGLGWMGRQRKKV